jgi:hypothetical protein
VLLQDRENKMTIGHAHSLAVAAETRRLDASHIFTGGFLQPAVLAWKQAWLRCTTSICIMSARGRCDSVSEKSYLGHTCEPAKSEGPHPPCSPAGVALWQCAQQLLLVLEAAGHKGEADYKLLTAGIGRKPAEDNRLFN